MKNSKIQNDSLYKIKINDENNHILYSKSNHISTTKYTLTNFISKIMIEQFSKLANIYFLIITMLQTVESISISLGKPVIFIPLLLVVFVNGVKDLWEDYIRKLQDNTENQTKTQIFNSEKEEFEEKTWEEVQLGDIVKVEENQYFPCDLLLISTSNINTGICYVETKNLDGESNLKYKLSNKSLLSVYNSDVTLKNLSGEVSTSIPNHIIYNFTAILKVENNQKKKIKKSSIFDYFHSNNEEERQEKETKERFLFKSTTSTNTYKSNRNEEINSESIILNNDSCLLRGCSLKQTKYIYGIAIYIGHDTKIMKNFPVPSNKFSRIEKKLQKLILFIFLAQIILALTGAIINLINSINGQQYLKTVLLYEDTYGAFTFITRIGTWVLIFTNLVPISLLVTLDMVKFLQAKFIKWDVKLYDKSQKIPANVQTSTLNEELGQINYIFSDKTGTLTKNCMTFKCMNILGNEYGNKNLDTDNSNDYSNQYCNFKDEDFMNIIHDKSNSDYDKISDFILSMSTCHSIFTESLESHDLQSSSPDELSFVTAAKQFGYQYLHTDIENQIYIKIHENIRKINQIAVLKYTSDRKRMSVVLNYNNRYVLITKGSDEKIIPLCNIENYTDCIVNSLKSYAEKGLRTLVFSIKDLTAKELDTFHSQYLLAISNNTNKKEELIEDSFCKIETNMILLGCTAIEDKLQDEVKETIKTFLDAGIKFWVITGDKGETAVKISISCGLIDTTTVLYKFDDENKKNISSVIDSYIEDVTLRKSIIAIDKIQSNESSIKIYNIESDYPDVFKKNNNYAITIGTESISAIMSSEELKDKVNYYL